MTKQRRDSAYFRQRLKTHSPAILKDLDDGKFKSVRSAAIAANLIKEPTKLDALKRAWRKATSDEQKEFLRWVRSTLKPVPARKPPSRPIVDSDGYLVEWAAKRIDEIQRKRKLSDREVTAELALKPLDTSLWSALRPGPRGKSKIRPEVVAALDKWLSDNRGI